MKLGVVGSRSFGDFGRLESEILDAYSIEEIALIVSGGAEGADYLAQRFAKKYGLSILIIYPNWDLYGKYAGPRRNKEIVENCDVLLAFWRDRSKGTGYSIEFARKLGRKVIVVEV